MGSKGGRNRGVLKFLRGSEVQASLPPPLSFPSAIFPRPSPELAPYSQFKPHPETLSIHPPRTFTQSHKLPSYNLLPLIYVLYQDLPYRGAAVSAIRNTHVAEGVPHFGRWTTGCEMRLGRAVFCFVAAIPASVFV